MPTHRIFLSHSHADNAWCEQFVETLRVAGLDVWFDKQGVYVGDDWIQVIEQELESRDTYLLVITPNSWTSDWVRKELAVAFARHKRVIGILHKPTAISGFLMTYQLLDATNLTVPEAAILVLQSLNVVPPGDPPAGNAEPPAATAGPLLVLRNGHVHKRMEHHWEEYIIEFQIQTAHVIRRKKSKETKTTFQLFLDDRLLKEEAFVVGKITHDFVVDGILFTYVVHVQWLWYSEQLSAQNTIIWRFPNEHVDM
jgi:hypothetical protein